MCNQCKCSPTFNIHLKRHKMSHFGEKPQKCKARDFSCISNSYLKNHTRGAYTAPFKCEQCLLQSPEVAFENTHWRRKSQTNSTSLIMNHCIHMPLRGHTVKKNITNATSVFVHPFMQMFSKHAIIHSEEKSDNCNQCDFASFQAGGLGAHL